MPGGTGVGENTAVRAGTAAGEDQPVGVEVRVALSTLLEYDQHPGELPGLGPIPAAHARDIVTRQRRAEWRYAITDPDGRLVFDGITRRRPHGLPATGPPGGIVELQVPATLLAELTTGDLSTRPETAAWAGLLADIVRHYAERDQRRLDAHPDDRLPRAGLRRHTQIRDRTCVGVGCRHRPRRCDQDHTTAYQHGGRTVAADLAPLCRHDHTLKGEGGWLLEQPTPGTFVWTSRLGGRYEVWPEPVQPPAVDEYPAPDDPYHDEPAPDAAETLILPRPPPPPPAPPEPIDLDKPPPF